MREKLSNVLSVRLTDTDLVRLTALIDKFVGGQAVPVRISRAAFAAAIITRALDTADESKIVPSHSPPSEGKILRVKRSQLRQRASKVA